jgi:hypothetical protein
MEKIKLPFIIAGLFLLFMHCALYLISNENVHIVALVCYIGFIIFIWRDE